MFERELVDSVFIQRWGIVRTLMPQSVAEHTFLVCHYANDIACYLGLSPDVHLALLQYGLWHDAKDEIFTGDLPGPNKRGLLNAIGPEAKKKWDAKLDQWAERTFFGLPRRSGMVSGPQDAKTVELVLKVADWLEAAIRMATETQMGNLCAKRHIIPNMSGAIETLELLVNHLTGKTINTENVPYRRDDEEELYWILRRKIEECIAIAQAGQSAGPWITREDENRTYHDPCVDN